MCVLRKIPESETGHNDYARRSFEEQRKETFPHTLIRQQRGLAPTPRRGRKRTDHAPLYRPTEEDFREVVTTSPFPARTKPLANGFPRTEKASAK
jgi:hypothetical protein